jgi:hypothetical protein
MVEKFLNFFGINGDQVIYDLKPTNAETMNKNSAINFRITHFPITVFDLFKNHLDFLGTPPRYL